MMIREAPAVACLFGAAHNGSRRTLTTSVVGG